jgi:LmbE family N-acetylglucosaminyl deacetylase
MKDSKTIIIFAPHTDDGELGCGGTIAKFIEQGNTIFYVAFSSAEKSVPPHLPKGILKDEVTRAVQTLGLDLENLILFNYEVRKFPEFRQDILEDMVRLNKTVQPDMVFLPSPNDTHQDHNTISTEGFRAFKNCTILGYELPWNNNTFCPQLYVELENKHVEKKINALSCYASQKGKVYMEEDFTKGLALLRGSQVNSRSAEAFEVIRWII